MANPTSLEMLPAEILNYVLDLLPKDALANLRLTSRYYQQRAKPYLYRHLTLLESTESAAGVREIIKDDSLALLVRELSLYTSLWDDNDHRRVLHDLRKLVRLRSLGIQFYPIMLRAYLKHNSDFFATIFSALMVSHFISCGLNRLSITNLRNQDEPFVTASLGFSQLIRNIRTLELGIWTFEHDTIETMSFYLQLPQTWLAPASPNLRVLHLSADEAWGWYPKVDFRGIYFPHLKDLTLGRFTFSHDWHLQWFSDHATSLMRLTFIDCTILDHVVSTSQHFDSEGYPLGLESHGDITQIQGSHSHKKRWSHYFNAIVDSLPRLLSFSLLSPDHVFRATHLQAVLEEELSLLRDACRYSIYCWGWYVPLFGTEDDHEHRAFGDLGTHILCEGEKQAQQEEDEQALKELLVVIQRRSGIRA